MTKMSSVKKNFRQGARAALRKQLERLQTTYVDVYMIHHDEDLLDSCGVQCYVDTWRVLEDMYKQGKIKALAVSNTDLAMLRKLISIAKVPPAIYQGKWR